MRDMWSYSANQVVRRLGEDATIWIDPNNIKYFVGSVKTRRKRLIAKILTNMELIRSAVIEQYNLLYSNKFLISEKDFIVKQELEEMNTFIYVRDYVNNIDDFRKSKLYEDLYKLLVDTGASSYKKTRFESKEQIDCFFEQYLFQLYKSFSDRGYDSSIASDPPKCYVAENGEIMKGENGRHRLAFAKALGVTRFPLVVFGVHENWYYCSIGCDADFAKLRTEIRNLQAINA